MQNTALEGEGLLNWQMGDGGPVGSAGRAFRVNVLTHYRLSYLDYV